MPSSLNNLNNTEMPSMTDRRNKRGQRLCAAATTDGRPCDQPIARPGQQVCHFHAGQAIPANLSQAKVAIATFDQEQYFAAAELFPNTLSGRDPDAHIRAIQQFAQQLYERGVHPQYVFIDLAKYVDWCRTRGLPVDSSASRAQYAAESAQRGDGLPYRPDQPLWPLGVTMIALRSELGPQLPAGVQSPLVRQFAHNLTRFMGAREGRYRTVVAASRYRTCDYAQLWQYFSRAVGSQDDLMFDDAFLSVSDTMRHEGQTLYITGYGHHDHVKTVCGLAAVGHGLAGIEHLGDKQHTIRVFDISPQRCDPVPVDITQQLLDLPDAPEARCGWAHD